MASSFSFGEQLVACDLCGGTHLSTVSSAAKVVECVSCGYRFANPRPSQAEIAASYSTEDFYDEWIEAEAGRLRMWSKRLELLKRTGPKVRLLDVGAGIGTFLSLARAQFGWDVVGTEVSASAIGIARDRYGIELMPGRIEDLALSAGAFDLITLWHVLEHVPSPAQTLALCRTLLAPDGLLAVAVPNDDDGRFWLVRTKGWLRRREPPPRYESLKPYQEVHLSQFKGRVVERALRSRGFRVEFVTVDDHYADPTLRSDVLVRAYRIIHRLTWLNFGQATFVLARKTAS